MALGARDTLKDEIILISTTTTYLFICSLIWQIFYLNIVIPLWLVFGTVISYILIAWPNLEVTPGSVFNFVVRFCADLVALAIGLGGLRIVLFATNTELMDRNSPNYLKGSSWPQNQFLALVLGICLLYLLLLTLFSCIRFGVNFFISVALLLRQMKAYYFGTSVDNGGN